MSFPELIRFPAHATRTEEGAMLVPFVSKCGLAGFEVSEPGGQVRYIYMNPSSGGSELPNVFVYEGTACDPNEDEPVVYVDALTRQLGRSVPR